MRRGLAAVFLAVIALAAFVPAAGADDGDPLIYFSFNDGWYYPQGYDEIFGFLCVSRVSAIVSCEGSQPHGSKLDTFNAGTHSVSVTATDFDGRQVTATQTYTVIDTTKPHVIFRTPSDGATYELGSELTYDYACEDDRGGLGIFECFSKPVGMPVDTSVLGTYTFEVVAVDNQFNVSQQSVTYTIADRTPPRITLSSPPEGGIYKLGDSVATWFRCDDYPFGSGISWCKGDVSSGAFLDTASVGAKTFTVAASDRAGNVAREVHAYSVIYDFAGFWAPATEYPAPSAMKAGAGVPLKFSLHGDQGSTILAAGSPDWIPCGAVDGSTEADGVLSYNSSSDRYTYLASTQKSWAGSCRDFVLTLRDGTTHRARFTFR